MPWSPPFFNLKTLVHHSKKKKKKKDRSRLFVLRWTLSAFTSAATPNLYLNRSTKQERCTAGVLFCLFSYYWQSQTCSGSCLPSCAAVPSQFVGSWKPTSVKLCFSCFKWCLSHAAVVFLFTQTSLKWNKMVTFFFFSFLVFSRIRWNNTYLCSEGLFLSVLSCKAGWSQFRPNSAFIDCNKRDMQTSATLRSIDVFFNKFLDTNKLYGQEQQFLAQLVSSLLP